VLLAFIGILVIAVCQVASALLSSRGRRPVQASAPRSRQSYDVGAAYGRFGRYLLAPSRAHQSLRDRAAPPPTAISPKLYVEDPHNTFSQRLHCPAAALRFCNLTLTAVDVVKSTPLSSASVLGPNGPLAAIYHAVYAA